MPMGLTQASAYGMPSCLATLAIPLSFSRDKQTSWHNARTLTRQMDGPFRQHCLDIQVDIPESVGWDDTLRPCQLMVSM